MNPKYLLLAFGFLFIYNSTYSQSFCWQPGDDNYWKVGLEYGSKRLSDCHISDANYNCHGFAMSYFEVPCNDPSWNNPGLNPYKCPTANYSTKTSPSYKDDNRYVRVCNEIDCKLVFYKTVNDAYNHSSVKDPSIAIAPFKYISKYGKDGPLVAHNLHGSFYHLTGNIDVTKREFWTFISSISTSNPTLPLTIGLTKSFSVLQSPGLTYTWTSVYGKFNIVSGQGSNAVIINPTYSGNDIIRLTVTSGNCGAGSTKVQEFPITVSPRCMDGTYSLGSTNNLPMNTVNFIATGQVITKIACLSASTITWVKTSGNLIFSPWNITNVLFNMTSGGSIGFTVTARNASNQIIQTKNISFFNTSGFSVFPNPSSEEINLNLPQDLSFEIIIIDLNSEKSFNYLINNNEKKSIDISNIENGEYIIKVIHEGQKVIEKRIIIKK